jgi:hypothetical protein
MRRITAATILAATAALSALTAVHAGTGHALADGSPYVACCKW